MSHHYGYPTWQPRYDIPNFSQGNGTESKHGSSYIEWLLDLLLLSNGYTTVDGETWENNKREFCLLNTDLKIHIGEKIIPSYVFIITCISFFHF